MAKRIATVTGTMLAPGVSANGRLYTPETIAKAVARLQERIADPTARPATMLTSHAAGDDSTQIVGRLTDVHQQPDGSARFTADIADTHAGRDIATLITGDAPFLRSTSIRGWWLGPVRKDTYEGQQVETADDLEIDGLDFTKSPGVSAALIDSATLAETTAGLPRTAITESLQEAHVTVTETTTEATTIYADPGYRPDGAKRHPLGSRRQIREAWAHFGVTENAEGYTTNQLKRIKGRIKAAGQKAGVNVAAESAAVTAAVTEALEEAWASVNLDNGQGSINVSGYTNDPSFLPAVGRRVALAALSGLTALDPDNDGDIDIDPADVNAAPGGDDLETAATAVITERTTMTAPAKPTPPKPLDEMSHDELTAWAAELQKVEDPATESTETSEATTETAEKPAEVTPEKPATESTTDKQRALTDADVKALAEALKPTTEASEKPVADQIAEAVAETEKRILGELGKAVGRSGLRRGLIEKVGQGEAAAPTKPLHEMDDNEFRRYRNEALAGFLGNTN